MDDLIIEFEKPKFASKHLDLFADKMHNLVKEIKNNQRLVFELFKLEWIAHEELVYLSSLFHYLKNSGINFYLKFKGNHNVNERTAKQIVSLWENWKIYSFVKINSQGFFDYQEYMDIDQNYIKYLKQYILRSYDVNNQVYNWYRITPFTAFKVDPQISYEEKILMDLKNIYMLDEITLRLLKKYQSETPFLNKSLSSIITKELYENSIEHAFKDEKSSLKECYFGLSLKNKFDVSLKNLQFVLKKNFDEEELNESVSFFKNGTSFVDQSYIQLTFLDYGKGISNTLQESYIEKIKNDPQYIMKRFNKNHIVQNLDTKVLEFAFDFTSSRFPISEKFENRNLIPRGLFDIVEIVKRYKGLLVVRSNNGKILFNFNNDFNSVKKSVSYFGDGKLFFPGTIISIYIPENIKGIKITSIKPDFDISTIKRESEYVSISQIQKSVSSQLKGIVDPVIKKKEIYNKTFDEIDKYLDKNYEGKRIVYFDFMGYSLEENSIKKILHYLASTVKINEYVNALIINPPDKELVALIRDEIIDQESDIKNYIYHPIPCIYINKKEDSYDIIWIGIQKIGQEKQLNQALRQEILDKSRSDFETPESIIGNIFGFDKYNNLIRNTYHVSDIAIDYIILKNLLKSKNDVYLTAGNYYQYEFISFLDALQNPDDLKFLTTYLINSIPENILIECDTIISITLSSQLLAKSFKIAIEEKYKVTKELFRLSNYHSFAKEKPFQSIKHGSNVILICDVISTGFLINDLKEKLKKQKSELKCVASLVDTRIFNQYIGTRTCLTDTQLNGIKIISVSKRPIEKYNRNIKNSESIIRINPITNSPNRLSVNLSVVDKILVNNNEDFMRKLGSSADQYLMIGNFEHNLVQHSYFIEIGKLLKEPIGLEILSNFLLILKDKETFRSINEASENTNYRIKQLELDLNKIINIDERRKENTKNYNIIKKEIKLLKEKYAQTALSISEFNINYVFYPIYSGIEGVDNTLLKHDILKGVDINLIAVPRINTPKGWRFTHIPDYLKDEAKDKTVLILDDGSCSGDSILQMINEICYLDVKKILVLSLIGRVEDFQREFLSRIYELKVNEYTVGVLEDNKTNQSANIGHSIPVHIYFGVHFHISIYLQNSLNPFWVESVRISKYKEILNVPKEAKEYIEKRIRELRPVEIIHMHENKYPDYLPIDKSTSKPPVVELFYFRDQIGKLNSHRFFSEYFIFFEKILAFYQKIDFKKSNTDIIYKDLELIIAVLIHEPNLIETINNLVPDLFVLLNEFIEFIVLDDNYNSEILYFKWKKLALVKFLFLMTKDVILLYSNTEKLMKSLIFCDTDEQMDSLNYFSFVFFDEMTHFPNDLAYGTENEIIETRILQLKQHELMSKLSVNAIRVLDNLENYSNTNQFNSDFFNFHHNCIVLRRLYSNEEVKGRSHNTTEKDLSIVKVQIEDLLGMIDVANRQELDIQNCLEIIKSQWPNIKGTLQLISRHAKSLSPVLKVFENGNIYSLFFDVNDSLDTYIIKFHEHLYENEGNFVKEIHYMSQICTFFKEKIIISGSPCKTFFKNYKVNVFAIFQKSFKSQIVKAGFVINEEIIDNVSDLLVNVHEAILKSIIYDIITDNVIEHAEDKSKVNIKWKINNDKIIFRIECKRKTASQSDLKEHKKSGLALIKEIGYYYKIETDHTNYDNLADAFYTNIAFPISK